MATFGALDEYRHTQIPLLLFHQLVKFDSQFDWAHKFYHTNNWFAVAARHFFDELTVGQNAIEFHIATNFVFETGFTNLQFVGLASLARESSDHMFERMVTSIQTDEARHAQIGNPVVATVMKHDPKYVQYLVDSLKPLRTKPPKNGPNDSPSLAGHVRLHADSGSFEAAALCSAQPCDIRLAKDGSR